MGRQEIKLRDSHDGSEQQSDAGGPECAAASEEKQRERPQQVELLFDSQGPEMAKVPGSVCNVIDGVSAGIEEIANRKRNDSEQQEGDGDQRIGIKRRKNPQDAAAIKTGKGDRASLFQFLQQQLGDEEAGDDEENSDSGFGKAQMEAGDGETGRSYSVTIEDK